MTRSTSKWLLAVSIALLTACNTETTVLGPAQPAAIERSPSVVDRSEFEDAAPASAQHPHTGRFSRYAMAAN